MLVLASFGLAAGPASARLTPKPPKDEFVQPTEPAQPGNGNGNAYGNDKPKGNGNANGHADANGTAAAGAPGNTGNATPDNTSNATPGGGSPSPTSAPTAQTGSGTPSSPPQPVPPSAAGPNAGGAAPGDDPGATLDSPTAPAEVGDPAPAGSDAPASAAPVAPPPTPPTPSTPPSRGNDGRTTDRPRPAAAPAPAQHVPAPAGPPATAAAAPARVAAPALAAPRTRTERVLGRYHTVGGRASVVRGVNGAAAVRIVAARAQRVDLVASRKLVAGRTRYRVNAWLRTDTPGVMVCLRFFERTRGPKSRILRSSETCVSPTSDWQRFRVEALAVTRGNVLRVAAVVYGPVGGETFELSRLKIERLVQGRWTKVRGAKLDSSLS